MEGALCHVFVLLCTVVFVLLLLYASTQCERMDMAMCYGNMLWPYKIAICGVFQVCQPPGERSAPLLAAADSSDGDSEDSVLDIEGQQRRRTRGVIMGHERPDTCVGNLATLAKIALLDGIHSVLRLPMSEDVEEVALAHINLFYNRYHVHDSTGRIYSLSGLIPIAHKDSPSSSWNALVRDTAGFTKVCWGTLQRKLKCVPGFLCQCDMAVQYCHI